MLLYIIRLLICEVNLSSQKTPQLKLNCSHHPKVSVTMTTLASSETVSGSNTNQKKGLQGQSLPVIVMVEVESLPILTLPPPVAFTRMTENTSCTYGPTQEEAGKDLVCSKGDFWSEQSFTHFIIGDCQLNKTLHLSSRKVGVAIYWCDVAVGTFDFPVNTHITKCSREMFDTSTTQYISQYFLALSLQPLYI